MAETGGKITLTANAQGDNTATFDIAGNLSIAQGITVGSTLNTGMYNGVIRAENNEKCLYFTGTAENTWYASLIPGIPLFINPEQTATSLTAQSTIRQA